MNGIEERLGELGSGAAGAPPVARVMGRGRQLRRRRMAVAVSAAAVVLVAGGSLGWPVWTGPGQTGQVVAAGPTLPVLSDGKPCRVVGYHAAPQEADGLRLFPTRVPAGVREWVARAGAEKACPRAAAPLVLVRYGPDRRTVQATFTLWGPGADTFGRGDSDGTATVRGHPARLWGTGTRPVDPGVLWTEGGMTWRAEGTGMRIGELRGLVEALRIDPGTGTADLTDPAGAGFTRGEPVPADPGSARRPGWTVMFNWRQPTQGELSISVHHDVGSLDSMLRAGARIITVRGHRAGYVPARPSDDHGYAGTATLTWEERPGVFVDIVAGARPGLNVVDIAESLRPIQVDDPRITH